MIFLFLSRLNAQSRAEEESATGGRAGCLSTTACTWPGCSLLWPPTKREIPLWLTALLEWDKKVTKAAFDLFDRRYGYVKHRSNLKFLEVSCHGLPWLGGVIVMLYMGSQNLELWMNLLVMLIIDIVLVAVVKAISRYILH